MGHKNSLCECGHSNLTHHWTNLKLICYHRDYPFRAGRFRSGNLCNCNDFKQKDEFELLIKEIRENEG
jgi:hypothetical protein